MPKLRRMTGDLSKTTLKYMVQGSKVRVVHGVELDSNFITSVITNGHWAFFSKNTTGPTHQLYEFLKQVLAQNNIETYSCDWLIEFNSSSKYVDSHPIGDREYPGTTRENTIKALQALWQNMQKFSQWVRASDIAQYAFRSSSKVTLRAYALLHPSNQWYQGEPGSLKPIMVSVDNQNMIIATGILERYVSLIESVHTLVPVIPIEERLRTPLLLKDPWGVEGFLMPVYPSEWLITLIKFYEEGKPPNYTQAPKKSTLLQEILNDGSLDDPRDTLI